MPPTTPDGRYIVVRGRLWRHSNPGLSEEQRQTFVDELMSARGAVGAAKRSENAMAMRAARARVQAAKVALGERGSVWWQDGAPDENRRLARNSSYAKWYAALPEGERSRS